MTGRQINVTPVKWIVVMLSEIRPITFIILFQTENKIKITKFSSMDRIESTTHKKSFESEAVSVDEIKVHRQPKERF